MAERLTAYVHSSGASRFIPPTPGTAEYDAWMDGMEPEVLLFNGGSEEKMAPNYSDWLYAMSQSKEAMSRDRRI